MCAVCSTVESLVEMRNELLEARCKTKSYDEANNITKLLVQKSRIEIIQEWLVIVCNDLNIAACA